MRLWLRNPLAILAEDAAGGLVVDGSRTVEPVPSGRSPDVPVDDVSEGVRHAVIPGLINTHHQFFQTVCSAHPAGRDKRQFPWLQALCPIWGRLNRDMFRIGARLALAELRSSGCITAMDHNTVMFAGLGDATGVAVEVEVEVEGAGALQTRATITRARSRR